MASSRHHVLYWVGAIVAVNLFTLALVNPDRPSSPYMQVVGVGYLLGSLYAQVTLAATWTALAPTALIWRIPLSLLWILILTMALAFNMGIHGGGPDEFVFVFGGLMLSQWLVLQLPLWGLKAGFQVQLRHFEDEEIFGRQQFQFGIRQLMIVTAIVGVVFALGRVWISALATVRGEPVIFVWLSVCAVISSLPLLIAALMRRGALLGVLFVLAMIALGAYFQVPLLRMVAQFGTRPNFYDLLSINLFTCGLILVTALAVRICGYSLMRLQNSKSI